MLAEDIKARLKLLKCRFPSKTGSKTNYIIAAITPIKQIKISSLLDIKLSL
jgi:hypothetical protein